MILPRRNVLLAYLAVTTRQEVVSAIAILREEMLNPEVFLMGRGEWSHDGIHALVSAINNGRCVIIVCPEDPADVPLLENLAVEVNGIDRRNYATIANLPLSIEAISVQLGDSNPRFCDQVQKGDSNSVNCCDVGNS